MFVTSDRELQYRLTTKGANEILKPGRWFRMAEKVIGSDEYQKLMPVKPVKEDSK